jgi:hypothetical protein
MNIIIFSPEKQSTKKGQSIRSAAYFYFKKAEIVQRIKNAERIEKVVTINGVDTFFLTGLYKMIKILSPKMLAKKPKKAHVYIR